MSPDHLCEEGPAHREDIKIPFHVIFSFSMILPFLYGIHLNAHFYFFGLIIRILSQTYKFLSDIYCILCSWYFILQFNHCVGPNLQILDSTQSRECEEDHKNLPVTDTPTIDTYVMVRLQIVLFQQNYFEEFDCISTYIADTIYATQNFYNPSVTVSTLHAYDTLIVYRDQQLQEFLDGEECCHNFINQDLTFLQPYVIYHTTDAEDNQSIASDSTDESILTVIENDQSQEVDSTPAFTSATALPEDLECTDYDHTPIQLVQPSPIQPVEPIIRLTEEEQRQREEDSNLTINDLLEFSLCEGHITTPLQTLDGQYVNQPSCFLPLAQEAQKLAKKTRQEEEASLWFGIPVKQLLNGSFSEQLNSIQTLQQIVPLQAAKEHLPKDIITILERLGKVDNTPFNKLYYLAENCADRYYMSVIKTFVEIIKCSATDH